MYLFLRILLLCPFPSPLTLDSCVDFCYICSPVHFHFDFLIPVRGKRKSGNEVETLSQNRKLPSICAAVDMRCDIDSTQYTAHRCARLCVYISVLALASPCGRPDNAHSRKLTSLIHQSTFPVAARSKYKIITWLLREF